MANRESKCATRIELGREPRPEGIDRKAFLRSVIGGSIALAVGAGIPGCTSITRKITEGAVEGAGDGADEYLKNHPELKKKLDGMINDMAAVTSNAKGASEKANEAAGKVNDLLKRHEADIDKGLSAAGELADMIRKILDILRREKEFFDNLWKNAEDALNALIYLFRQLALKIGVALAELIAYFLYLLFKQAIDRLIEELRRKYWIFRWFAAVM
jgi:hypothetical protein